jgi:hypothetical protein
MSDNVFRISMTEAKMIHDMLGGVDWRLLGQLQ